MIVRTAIAATFLSLGVAMADSNQLVITPLSEKQNIGVELDLEAGRFSVHGGCNTMMGSVMIDSNDAFIVEPNRMATTLMACRDDLQALDNRITAFMENSPKIVRQGDALYLVATITDESESHYIPVNLDKGTYKDIEARAYDKIFVYVSSEQKPCQLDGTEEHKQCLQIRFDKDDKWQVFNGEIKGFTPEKDVEYRLRLKSYETESEDAHDWELDMIVEQGIVKE